MNKSHLINILRACSRKELRELSKWLRSPAHNQRQDVVRLFDYLIEDDRLYKDAFLEKSSIFPWVHPKETFDDAKLRQTIYFFMKAMEEFLIYTEITQDEIYSKTALARVYRKKKLSRTFEKNMRLAQKLQEKLPIRNGHHLRNEYLLQQEMYTYNSELKERTTSFNLQEVSDALDATYIADKLRQSCFILAHQNVYQTQYEVGLLNDVLKYVEERDFLKIPAIAIYYYGYRAIKEKGNEHYFQHLKKEIVQNGHLFPRAEIRDIYLMAINYCIGQINAGVEAFIQAAFELYREGFEQGVLIENKNVSRWTFLNAVINGLKLQEYDWVENFIHDNQIYLEENNRHSVVCYSKARLYYEKGDYDQSMHFINEAEYDDILINLNAKTILFKMYYEQEEYDALESLLESIRNYLVRKKVMGYHKSNYQNIIRYTKKLLKANPYNQNQKIKLQEEIKAANPLTEREWLLEQVKTL